MCIRKDAYAYDKGHLLPAVLPAVTEIKIVEIVEIINLVPNPIADIVLCIIYIYIYIYVDVCM